MNCKKSIANKYDFASDINKIPERKSGHNSFPRMVIDHCLESCAYLFLQEGLHKKVTMVACERLKPNRPSIHNRIDRSYLC